MSEQRNESSAATTESERIKGLIVARLRDHLARIAAQDWDYFAGLRYRQEAQQAVSDLERLVRLHEKEASRV